MKVWEESVNFSRMDDKAELAIAETNRTKEIHISGLIFLTMSL